MKNGTIRRGKQNHQGRDCGRQFVEKLQWPPKDKDTSALINRFLLEQDHKQWVWLVLAVGTRASIGCQVGDRAPNKLPKPYGILCLAAIGKIPASTPTIGQPTLGCYRVNDILPWVRSLA